MTDTNHSPSGQPAAGREERVGMLLVFLSAFVWSTGGTIARFLEADDSWTVVFWRSFFAALFLLGFLVFRDGARGAALQFRAMGIPASSSVSALLRPRPLSCWRSPIRR